MQPLRLWVFLAFIVGLRAYELSQNLASVYCVITGDFDNKEQVEKDGPNRTEIVARLVPVLVPALSPIPIILAVEFSNGDLVRAEILNLTENEDGTVFGTPYNITGRTNIKPETFNPDSIKSFTWDDLQGNPDCRQSFVLARPLVITVNWPDCLQSAQKEKRESYGATVTCDEWIAIPPAGAPENPQLVPYQIKRRGQKYPLEGAPDSYVCDCDSTRN